MAKSGIGWSQSRKGKCPGDRQRYLVDPIDEAGKIHAHGYQNMLNMSFRLAKITRPTQTEGASSLGNGALNLSPFSITFFEFKSVFPLPSLLQEFYCSLGLKLKVRGSSAERVQWVRTGQARQLALAKRT